jgi:hypothetical protein
VGGFSSSASKRGKGFCGQAPTPGGAFGQFQYPTPPLATATADPERVSLASTGRAAQRLVMDKGNLR